MVQDIRWLAGINRDGGKFGGCEQDSPTESCYLGEVKLRGYYT